MKRRPVTEVFLKKSFPEPNTGCWLWSGQTTRNGYGVISYNGKSESVHRFVYKFYIGKFDESLHVLHRCDVRCCVNPDHLFLGTHQENMIDRNSKGRCAILLGEVNGNSKLTADQVLLIRRLYDYGDHRMRDLAVTFGVSQRLIFNIIHRKTWKHI